jgi:UDP-perosamine 4-acetyltransferase
MRERTRLLGLGASGHAKVIIEILRLRDEYDFFGLLDSNPELAGSRFCGIQILGDDTRLKDLYQQGISNAFLGVGSVGDTAVRKRLFTMLKDLGFKLVSTIHPQAIISSSARMGEGPIVMANAVVNPDARIGDNVIINTGAIVEHDCIVESHVHVATGARLAGSVTVREGSHIGIGASVKQGVVIERGAIVGAGAVVIHDVAEGATVVGVPARAIANRLVDG